MLPQSSRLGGLKSWSGCVTCKIRRVKCGEEKPRCYRCSSTGRRCEYKSPPSALQLQPTKRSGYLFSTSSRFLDLASFPPGKRERREFEYYFHRVAPSLSGGQDLNLWRGAMLQVCRSEPPIWDAIIAISALFEHPPINRCAPFLLLSLVPPAHGVGHLEALSWYSRSLETLQRRLRTSAITPTVALISCLLFITIELLQGNMSAAVTLHQQGVNLLMSTMSTPAGVNHHQWDDSFYSMIAPVFTRMGALALIMAGTMPIHMPSALIPSKDGFHTLDEAKTALYVLVMEWKVLHKQSRDAFNGPRNIDSPYRPQLLFTQQRDLEGRLLMWRRKFEAMRTAQCRSLCDGIMSTLLMTYMGILVETRVCLSDDETDYDAHETLFAQILSLTPAALAATTIDNDSQPPFTFEMGVGLPLFITALKCRSPQLRREALRFLRQAPPVQGMYMCRPAAHIVAAVISLEEDPGRKDVSPLQEVLSHPGRLPQQDNLLREFSVMRLTSEGGLTQTWLKYRLLESKCVEGVRNLTERAVLLPEIDADT